MHADAAPAAAASAAGAMLAVVAGDSHCLAFDGASNPRHPGLVVRTGFCSAPEGFFTRTAARPDAAGVPRAIPLLRDAVAGALDAVAAPPASRLVVLALAGADSIVETMDTLWQRYDFALPEHPRLFDHARERVPAAVVAGWIDRDLAMVLPAVADLAAAGLGPLAVLPPPPPHRADAALTAYLRGVGIDRFIAPFAVRAKVAWLYREGLRRICADAGISFVDSWSFAADELALKPAYEHDGFHANRAFAEACVPLIAAAVSAQG